MTAKSKLLATQPGAVAFYGTEVTQLLPTHLHDLETAALGALWDTHRPHRCKEIVLTLFTLGHRVDPAQAIPYTRLVGFVRMLQHRPDLRPLVRHILHCGRHRSPCGPVGLATQALSSLGWSCTALFTSWVVIRHNVATNLLTVDPPAWAHEVREAARQHR